jgi:hypothetical protein
VCVVVLCSGQLCDGTLLAFRDSGVVCKTEHSVLIPLARSSSAPEFPELPTLLLPPTPTPSIISCTPR